MIDVIIPAYNSHETLTNGLLSILMQTMSDNVHVYVVDDCSKKGYEDIVKRFDGLLDITLLRTPQNMGPGFARQYGIEASNSEYIIFMDADDEFYNALSFYNLYNAINNNNFDLVISHFIEEIGAQKDLLEHDENEAWMHGKIYRRKFIEDNNIRFSYTKANEDTGFNRICYILTDNIGYIDDITYVWKYTPTAITKNNDYEFSFKGLEGFIYNSLYAVEQAKDADLNRRAKMIFKTIYEIYYNYIYYINEPNSYELLDWSKELKEKYYEYLNVADNQVRIDALYEIEHKMYNCLSPDLLANSITFDEFVNLIGNNE